MSQKVVNPYQAAQKHHIASSTVVRLIKEQKVAHVFEAKQGRGVMRMYEEEVLDAVINKYVLEQAEKIKKASEKPIQPEPVVSLSGVEKRLDLVDASLAELVELVEKLTQENHKLMEQNTIIFKRVEILARELAGEKA